MNNLFIFLSLVFFVCLIVGLIKPTFFSRFSKSGITRKKIGLIFGVGTLVFFILFAATTDTDKKKNEVDTNEKFSKVISIAGNQSSKSEEFVINSKEIKFVYQCEEGASFCGARLHQVGGENQELFRSSGNTGPLSGEKILSVGPGTFYISIDNTRDRAYKIDVFQSIIPASTEETTKAQTKVDENEKYRNISGFTLTSENMLSGVLTYNYKTGDGVYIIELHVYPREMADSELEEKYTLAKGNLKINDVNIQYAFHKGSELNGVVISKPYEDAEFVFVVEGKTHFGWVRKADFDETVDQTMIESTLKPFLNVLLPNISGDK